ncbi:MAG: glycosyl hydrolase family 18 protein [Bryobacteraceae bacterium]
MNRLFPILILAVGVLMAAPKALFYVTSDTASVNSFLAHADKIDIVVPTWYQVDGDGLVSGGPDPLVMEAAKSHRVPVMPIVANVVGTHGFDQPSIHKLLGSAAARQHMISALASECASHGYTGIQFDFENVVWTDRDALTTLVAETAETFHKQGLQLSIATVPNAPGAPGGAPYSRWIFENWQGAYDLAGLAKHVDLLCLMTYDEHTRFTPPGPVSGYPWALANLEYALKAVPREKLSLGIPVYGYRWFAGDPGADGHPSATAADVKSADLHRILDTYHPQVQWDDRDKAPWFFYYRDGMREWVFYTDARAFKERLALVRERGLQGFCSWSLGQEEPAIWDALPAHP